MAAVPNSAKREKIIAEVRRRYEAGDLSPEEQERAKAFLVEAIREMRESKQAAGKDPDSALAPELEVEEVETEGLPQRREPGVLDQARAMATGMDTFMDMAINQAQDPQNPRSILQRYDQLKSLPEIQSLRLGGDEELNMGKAFLADIGMQELQGKEAEIRKLRRAQSTIREAAGALSDTKNLEKVIKNQLGPFGVETQTVGGSVYMKFKDPITGKQVESWANRPGFSLNDIPSADEVLAGAGAFLGGRAVLQGGRKAIQAGRNMMARRDARVTRGPGGQFTSKRSQRRRAEEAQDQRISQQQIRVQPGQRAPAPSRGATGRVERRQDVGENSVLAPSPTTRQAAAEAPKKGIGPRLRRVVTGPEGGGRTAASNARAIAQGLIEDSILAQFGVIPASTAAARMSGKSVGQSLRAGQRAWARRRMLRRATSTK